MSKLIALIPARGGSKGLPNKNILDLHGRPLIEWSIAFAKSQPCIDGCFVSTDSPVIADIARQCGAEVPFLRSDTLSSDTAKTSDVIIDFIKRSSIDSVDDILLLEPTSPYRTSFTFENLIKLYRQTKSKKAVSVTEAVSSSHVFQYSIDFETRPVLKNVNNCIDSNGVRRQDIKKSYYLDGSFYMSKVSAFIEDPAFVSRDTVAVLSDYFSSFEIDCENDLKLMRAIFKSIGLPF